MGARLGNIGEPVFENLFAAGLKLVQKPLDAIRQMHLDKRVDRMTPDEVIGALIRDTGIKTLEALGFQDTDFEAALKADAKAVESIRVLLKRKLEPQILTADDDGFTIATAGERCPNSDELNSAEIRKAGLIPMTVKEVATLLERNPNAVVDGIQMVDQDEKPESSGSSTGPIYIHRTTINFGDKQSRVVTCTEGPYVTPKSFRGLRRVNWAA